MQCHSSVLHLSKLGSNRIVNQACDHSGGDQYGNDDDDQQPAEVGSRIASAVDVSAAESEHDQENQTDNGDGKENGISHISPGGDGLELRRAVVIVFAHGNTSQ